MRRDDDRALGAVVHASLTRSYAQLLRVYLQARSFHAEPSEWTELNLRLCFHYHQHAAGRLRRDVKAWERSNAED